MKEKNLLQIVDTIQRRFFWLTMISVLIAQVLLSTFAINAFKTEIDNSIARQLVDITRRFVAEGDLIFIQRSVDEVAIPFQEFIATEIQITDKFTGRLVAKRSIGQSPYFSNIIRTSNSFSTPSLQGNFKVELRSDFTFFSTIGLLISIVVYLIIFLIFLSTNSLLVSRTNTNLFITNHAIEWLEKFSVDSKTSEISFDIEPKGSESLVGPFVRIKDKIVSLNEELIALRTKKEVTEISRQLAHDIRSPLAALEILNTSKLSNEPEDQKMLELIIGRIRDISNRLLNNKNSASNECDPANVIQCIREIIASKKIEFHDLNVRFRLNFEEGAENLLVTVDRNELLRVFSNLINNGVEASPQNAIIQIEVGRSEIATVDILFNDNGGGVPKIVIENMGTVGLTIGKPSGNGLGLSYACRFAAANGGVLTLKSTSELGSSFKLALPVTNKNT
jgi:signal transduction histidine kinase